MIEIFINSKAIIFPAKTFNKFNVFNSFFIKPFSKEINSSPTLFFLWLESCIYKFFNKWITFLKCFYSCLKVFHKSVFFLSTFSACGLKETNTKVNEKTYKYYLNSVPFKRSFYRIGSIPFNPLLLLLLSTCFYTRFV